MTNAIFEILQKNYGSLGQNVTSAREIAEMMTAFIEWSNDHFYGGIRWHVDGQDEMTTDELFTYWKENIKKQ